MTTGWILAQTPERERGGNTRKEKAEKWTVSLPSSGACAAKAVTRLVPATHLSGRHRSGQ